MITLSHGVLKPEAGDRGNIFCPALSQDMQILNDHIHDGITSSQISFANLIRPSKSTLASAGWGTTIGNGLYKQTVSCPGTYTYDNLRLEARIATGSTGAGNVIYPTIEKVSANTFSVTTNDNTIGIDILYT